VAHRNGEGSDGCEDSRGAQETLREGAQGQPCKTIPKKPQDLSAEARNLAAIAHEVNGPLRRALLGLLVTIEDAPPSAAQTPTSGSAPASAPHVAALRCAGCGRHHGWLGRQTAIEIAETIDRYFVPATPIVIRRRGRA
jgi:hypothetical protein